MHSSRPTDLASFARPLALALLLGLGQAAFAAPAKKAARPAVSPKAVERETVFIAMPTPPPAPREEVKVAPPREDVKPRKAPEGPIPMNRKGIVAYGLALGANSAEMLGTTPIFLATCDLYPIPGPMFFQFTAGGGWVQSDFSKKMIGGSAFENNWLLALETLGGYTIDLSGRHGRDVSRGLFPYFLTGMTLVLQGGVPNFGGVVGFGHRFPVPFLTRNDNWTLVVQAKDQIYSQKIRTTPSLTQNFVVTLGVQTYF